MQTSEITNPLFREAVEAIDAGHVSILRQLLEDHPQLISMRLDAPTEGYFKQPYLLWFVADNPIRNKTLPANIVEITQLLLEFARQHAVDSFQEQIDYTLGLVTTGSVPRDCGVQIPLMDLLIDAGATPGGGHGALAHGNQGAAQRLIERGGELTLATAIGLNRIDDIVRLAKGATATDRQIALVVAAFYGKSDWLAFLIQQGVDVNAYLDPSSGFHSHATALHQAVYSGSLDSVKVLVEAGANLDLGDRIHHSTPLGWAVYMQTETVDAIARGNYAEIETYLQEKKNEPGQHAPQRTLIGIQGMAPLFQVFDMPTSLRFYRDIIGFQVVESSGEGDDVDWIWLRLDTTDLMLNTAYEKPYRPAKPDPDRVTAHADTSLYFGCPDVDATYTYLKAKGLDIEPPSVTGYGFKALYCKDPDGFELVFHWPL